MNTSLATERNLSDSPRITKPLVSVTVVTYQRRDHLRWCLEALACQSFPKDQFEVAVVDDGGTDDSGVEVSQVIERYPKLDVHYYWHEHRGWGLARSRNEGARATSGACIVFIDSDILLNPDSLKSFSRLYWDNPYRVIGGYYKYLIGMRITLNAVRKWDRLWNMKLPEIDILQHEYQLLGTDVREAHFNQGRTAVDLFADEEATYRNPYSLLGGNIMVPRHIWDQTQGFDELIPHYGGEDAEFSLQIADLGYSFSYSHAAGGAHMAHSKHPDAELNTGMAEEYLRRRWPTWFTNHGEPIWAYRGWVRPRSGGRTSDADME